MSWGNPVASIIPDTDRGTVEVRVSSAIFAGGKSGRFVWLTVTPGPMSAPGTAHLSMAQVDALIKALSLRANMAIQDDD